MENYVFDEIGADKYRYITGWGKYGVAFSEKEGIGYLNHKSLYFHTRDTSSQIKMIREGNQVGADTFKYELFNKITFDDIQFFGKVDAFFFRSEALLSVFILLVSGSDFSIDFRDYGSKILYNSAVGNILADWSNKQDEMREIVLKMLTKEAKKRNDLLDEQKRFRERSLSTCPAEYHIKRVEFDFTFVCKFCNTKISDEFDCDPNPKNGTYSICPSCGARYEVTIENVQPIVNAVVKDPCPKSKK